MPSLTIRTGQRANEVIAFDRTIVIGRGAVDVVLDDSTVSRRHAELAWENGRCTVTDLRTGNGTFVNGRRLTAPTAITDGDELWLGRVVLRYSSGQADHASEPASAALLEEQDASPSIVMVMDARSSGVSASRGADVEQLIEQLNRRVEVLGELAADLAQTFDEQTMFGRVMERLFELLPRAERGLLLIQDDGGALVPKIARTRAGEDVRIGASRTLLQEVISRRQGILSVDAQGDQRFSAAESLIASGIRTLVCVPLYAYDRVYGVIQVDSTRGTLPFVEADLALALAVARQLAMALANARMHRQLLEQELFQRDLALARSIQRHFLPRHPPEVPGACFAVEYSPALAVGGDYYDFLYLPDGRLGLAIGDVSGKGVSAALYVAKLGSELRYAAAALDQPARILERVNAELAADNDEAMFVTLLLAALDPVSGQLAIVNAGHLRPVLRQRDGGVRLLDTPAQSPLGVREDVRFEQTLHQVDRSEVLALYSDGVTEATSRSRELFGDERLLQSVSRAAQTASGVCAALVAGVRAFLDGEPQNDDITVVTFGPCG